MSTYGKKLRAWHRWILDLDVDHFAKAVLHTLRYYVNDNGECWPSIDRIANESGMSERKAQMVIRDLTDGGHIEVTQSPGRNPNVYPITLYYILSDLSTYFTRSSVPAPECSNSNRNMRQHPACARCDNPVSGSLSSPLYQAWRCLWRAP